MKEGKEREANINDSQGAGQFSGQGPRVDD